MKSKIIITSCLIVGALFAIGAYVYLGPILISRGNAVFNNDVLSEIAAAGSAKKQRPKQSPSFRPESSPFIEDFNTTYAIKESGSMNGSNYPNWWLSSSAYFY